MRGDHGPAERTPGPVDDRNVAEQLHCGLFRQLDALVGEVLAQFWATGASPHRLDELLVIDCHSTSRESHGLAKPGALFGCTGVRPPLPRGVTARRGRPRSAGIRLAEEGEGVRRGPRRRRRAGRWRPSRTARQCTGVPPVGVTVPSRCIRGVMASRIRYRPRHRPRVVNRGVQRGDDAA